MSEMWCEEGGCEQGRDDELSDEEPHAHRCRILVEHLVAHLVRIYLFCSGGTGVVHSLWLSAPHQIFIDCVSGFGVGFSLCEHVGLDVAVGFIWVG